MARGECWNAADGRGVVAALTQPCAAVFFIFRLSTPGPDARTGASPQLGFPVGRGQRALRAAPAPSRTAATAAAIALGRATELMGQTAVERGEAGPTVTAERSRCRIPTSRRPADSGWKPPRRRRRGGLCWRRWRLGGARCWTHAPESRTLPIASRGGQGKRGSAAVFVVGTRVRPRGQPL